MPYPWVMVTASSPEGGMAPHVYLPGLHPTLRKSSEGECVEAPAFPGHWQDWVLLLPIGNPHHRTMGGKSEAPCEGVLPSHLFLLCVGPGPAFQAAGFSVGSCATRERQELVWL